MRNLLAVLTLLMTLSTIAQPATQPSTQPAPRSFPFVMPWDDASANVTDVSSLNPAPLEEEHRITVKDGRFYDGTGRRVRFVGTNFTSGGCFPSNEDAEKVAKRLRKFGINCVRLHHMDAEWAQPNLFYVEGGTYGDRTTEKLSEESLDRLDYLVHQLKLNGIYVDINLHVSREFKESEGFPEADKLPGLHKVVGYFEPKMIERQKLFAEQLLTHKNPYTGMTYAEDPVVAIIELTNEDSLLGSADQIATLPEHYRNILKEGWNAYLKEKYGSTEELLEAWNTEAKPLGEDLLRNGRFTEGTEGWTLEAYPPGATADMTSTDVAGATNAPPGRALHLSDLKLDGTDWHLQLHQTGLDLKPNEMYTISFAARAEEPRRVHVGSRLDQDPWSFLGLDQSIELGTNWNRYTISFVTNEQVVPNHGRISFILGGAAPAVYLADVTLRPGGGGIDLASGQSLEEGNLELPTVGPNAQGRDYVSYLMKVEQDFTQQMRDHIQKTLGSRAPVLCSQASYGGLGGVLRESKLDVVDMHSYWQHPSFPNNPWDSNDYRISNTPMVSHNGAGTLDGLAMHRVAGMPFIVSEYDHPAPNEYAAEMIPMLFAYAAWQDWDGVFPFCYNGDDDDYADDKIQGFFDQAHHPAKMAFLPFAAQVFLRPDGTRPAPGQQVLLVPESQVPDLVARGTNYSFWNAALPSDQQVSAQDMFNRRTSLRIVKNLESPQVKKTEPEDPQDQISRLGWTHGEPGTGLFTLNSRGAKSVVGFLGGRSVDLGGVVFEMEPTERNFLSLALSSMDGKATDRSNSLLLVALEKAENPGLEWNADRTFAEHSWEKGPVHAFAVPVKITLPTTAKSATVHALDPSGARVRQVPAELVEGKIRFQIGPEDETIWYEIACE